LPQVLYARHPAHFGQLFRCERLGVGVRQRRGHDLFIGHCFERHELRVEFFQSIQVFECCDGVHEIHAVLAKVFCGFAIVPFV
jgi:hypothetical protein